jgi:hypothetical protein
MMPEDRELLGRISKVNQAAGEIALRVLSGIADDDTLSGDYDDLGRVYSQLGDAFTQRAAELGQRRALDP